MSRSSRSRWWMRAGAACAVAALGLGCTPRPEKDTTVVHVAEAVSPSAEPEIEPASEPARKRSKDPDTLDRAEAPDEPADQTQARDLFQQGAEAYAQGDYPKACEAFRAAYKLAPVQPLLFNIGSCELRMGDTTAACGHFRQYIANGDPADPRVQQVQAQVASRCRGVP